MLDRIEQNRSEITELCLRHHAWRWSGRRRTRRIDFHPLSVCSCHDYNQMSRILVKQVAIEEDDWRLQGGTKLVMGHTLTWKKWRAPRPSWDHDHCTLCFQRLAEPEKHFTDAQYEGYADERDYYWLCRQCALDFKDTLNLILIGGPAIQPKE
jgi:hypothetical protein